MKDILEFLLKHCLELFSRYGFRFADSEVVVSFGNAYATLRNDNCVLMLIRDRGQLFLDFQSRIDTKKRNGYSFELVRSLLEGDGKIRTAEMTEDGNAEFLEEHLGEILALFHPTVARSTAAKLKALEKSRAKQIFG